MEATPRWPMIWVHDGRIRGIAKTQPHRVGAAALARRLVAHRVLRRVAARAGDVAIELAARNAPGVAAPHLPGHGADPVVVHHAERSPHDGDHAHRRGDGPELRLVALRARDGDPGAGAGAYSPDGRAVRRLALHHPPWRAAGGDAAHRAVRGAA